MAKISATPALVAGDLDPAADLIPVVDASESSDADKNKRMFPIDFLNGALKTIMENNGSAIFRASDDGTQIEVMGNLKAQTYGYDVENDTGTISLAMPDNHTGEFAVDLDPSDTVNDAIFVINANPGSSARKSNIRFNRSANAAESNIILYKGDNSSDEKLRLTWTPGSTSVTVTGSLDFLTEPKLNGVGILSSTASVPIGSYVYADDSGDIPAGYTWEGFYKKTGVNTFVWDTKFQPGMYFRDWQASDFTGGARTLTAADFFIHRVIPSSLTTATITLPNNLHTFSEEYATGFFHGAMFWCSIEVRAGQTLTLVRGSGCTMLVPTGGDTASTTVTGYRRIMVWARGTTGGYWTVDA